MKQKKLFNMDRYWWTALFVILIIVGYAMVGMNTKDASKHFYNDAIINLDSGWETEAGNFVMLSDLPHGDITIERSVADIDFTNKRLCFKSVDTFFEVIADKNVIYTYYPEQKDILGSSYGMYIHEIPIPVGTETITLKLFPIFDRNPAAFINTLVIDPGMYMGDLFKKGIPGFCICLLMLILGIILILVSILTAHENQEQQIEFFSLGAFSALIAIWAVNDTMVLQVLTQSPAVIRMINYITLIFLPYFPVSFIAGAVNQKKTKLLPVLFFLICVNFILNITLSSLKIVDYFNLVTVSQCIIVVALCMGIYLVVSAIHKKSMERSFLIVLILGLGAGILGTGIDLLRYRFIEGVDQSASFYTCIGAFIFLVLIGIYFIREYSRVRMEKGQAEVMARLAYLDGLTGLKNRRAFNEVESELQGRPEETCIVIQFDINNMKKVNDEYGHMAGDKHIIAAANAIQKSFEEIGACYRTGGDEFIVLITESADVENAKHALQDMEKNIQAYNQSENPPVPLEIAYGMALHQMSGESLKNAELLADQRMYECKRRKKSSH